MRLIDADRLKADFIGKRYGVQAIEYMIDQQPTVVEAEPIRHGEWLMDDDSGDIQCSCCGHWSFDTYDEPFVIDGHKGIATVMPHYCGYCGAKMD